jgi:hypothetical protein
MFEGNATGGYAPGKLTRTSKCQAIWAFSLLDSVNNEMRRWSPWNAGSCHWSTFMSADFSFGAEFCS